MTPRNTDMQTDQHVCCHSDAQWRHIEPCYFDELYNV